MPPNKALPTIYYVRHGETESNKQGLIQGSLDVELNAHGHAQAQAVAKALGDKRAELAGFKFVVSPQIRAQQTAYYIAAALGVHLPNINVEPRVRELGFGIWEGKPSWELKASPIYPADPETRYSWRPEGGESYADGVARVQSWLQDVTEPTLLVAHGAVGRCLMGFVSGRMPADIVTLPTPQGCYCVLKDGAFTWFDAAHLGQ